MHEKASHQGLYYDSQITVAANQKLSFDIERASYKPIAEEEFSVLNYITFLHYHLHHYCHEDNRVTLNYEHQQKLFFRMTLELFQGTVSSVNKVLLS